MNLANKITLLRVLMVPVFVVVFYLDIPFSNYLAASIFIIASFTDALDGHIARSRNLITNFGKFADPLADKVLAAAALIVLVSAGKVPAWVVIIIIAREFAISGFRIIAASEGITIAASKWGKAKTISQLTAIILLLLNNFPFSYLGIPMDVFMLYLALVLTIISGADYIIKNYHILSSGDR
ncbi:CDP-diacylglycerol--glycerol-3-phosphate 3-phosphatidyltransferase [Gudongella oleilytica]|jgi:CDP-diacylglycerol--glycerol-3-phosphate 3-phosphatidyltransferase|uniref:CDP-diacylglycerol--glycerol-3-phosphate 3-phosphatidyltransferase n=1 Tax=Gudongella oleilytica TaxID=1582259 RepID=UPI000EC1612B|nr:CDP-diacylglycerol--glycerol-3-phosphate 3-phosphatidyltransferase [Gudongella oleilytica]MDY0255796.1 CDP-diacylglycerol--glycerol-3-phosphate 3-phosphatidyltransferase [Gudongella oleilytica]HCO19001.1 CDP-diacylglycerol--glycerol-3-phosphate 3-phosphatidyltransferase [Tissierellales bacterium]HMM68932.1 CDP-diacylglycerol--glycerol-3-phosphate 3-phosphatidyltransferase [Gudongella oleilytica]